MSSRYVRTTVQNWLRQGNVPFYPTVNVEQNPTDDAWCTVMWAFGDKQVDTYCRTTTEYGTFNVIFFGIAGIGDDTLLSIAEPEMELLLLRQDPNNRLVLLEYNSPVDFRQDEHYCLEFQVSYEMRA